MVRDLTLFHLRGRSLRFLGRLFRRRPGARHRIRARRRNAGVRTVATTAERLGFSTIWAPEHVVLLDEYASKYPYSSGKFPGPADTPIADPFTTLAYAAACTSKIRLGTGICLVPEHNPLVLAKTVATSARASISTLCGSSGPSAAARIRASS